MGGKSSTSTSSVNIPPQILQRYENVNNIASQVAQQPYQQYSTDPNAYVAPLTSTQQAGIYNTNQYAGAAQPYIQAAANATSNAVNSTAPYFGQAAQTTLGAQQAAQPYYGAAGALTAAGAGPANLGQLQTNRYMSPYLQDVVSQQIAAQNLQNAQQQSALQGSAIQAGAFGGDRAGVAQANLGYQQNLANQQALANTLQSGYTQAQNTAAQQQAAELSAQQANLARLQQAGQQFAGLGSAQGQLGLGTGAQLGSLGAQQGQLGLAGAQQYGNLGLEGQTAALQGAQQQLAAGQVAQQTQQQGLTALANQYQQQQSYPFQVAQFLANIAEGTGALSGSTTTSTQPRGFFSARGGRIERAEGGLVPSSQGGAVNPEFAGQGFADGGSPAGLGTLGGLLPGAAQAASPGFAMGNSDFQFYNPVAAGIAAKPKFDQNYSNIFSQALQQYQEPVVAQGFKPVASVSPAWNAGSEGGGGLGTSANQGMSGPDTYSGPQFGGLPGGIGDAAQAAADVAAAQSQADAQAAADAGTYNQGGRIHRDDGGLIPYGGKSYVPQIQQQQPRQLMTASLPRQNPSDFQQLMAAGNVGMGVENLYKNASNKDSLLGQGFDWAKKQFAYGGDVDPYDDQGLRSTGVAGQHALNIPQNTPRPGLNPAQGPTGSSAATGLLGGLGAIGSAATGIAGLGKLGSTVGSGVEELLPLFGLKNGGRAGYATDGFVTDADDPTTYPRYPNYPPEVNASPNSNPRDVIHGGRFAQQNPLGINVDAFPTEHQPEVNASPNSNPRDVIHGGRFAPRPAPPPIPAQTGVAPSAPTPAMTGRLDKTGLLPASALQPAPGQDFTPSVVNSQLLTEQNPTNLPKLGQFDPVAFHAQYIIPIESNGRQLNADGTPYTSSAGAVGISQIMPKTGPEAAAMAGVPYDENRLKTDQDYNKLLGSAYYTSMYNRYKDPVIAGAAYNAGPGAVDAAMAKAAANGGSFVDYLPAETQNYVAKLSGGQPASISATTGLASAASQTDAPTVAPPPKITSPTGVVAESPDVMSQYLKEKNNSFVGRNQDWLIPLLSGIGTMASSPSRYLGAALLQGVGGAGSAYENVQNQQTARIKALAESQKTQQEAGQVAPVSQAEIFQKLASGQFSMTDAAVKLKMTPAQITALMAQSGLHIAQTGAVPSQIAEANARAGLIGAQTGAVPSQIAKTSAEAAALQAGVYERIWIPGRGFFVYDKTHPNAPPKQTTDENLNPIGTPENTPPPQNKLSAPPTANLNTPAGHYSNIMSPAQSNVPEGFTPPNQMNMYLSPGVREKEQAAAEPQLAAQRAKATSAYQQSFVLDQMKHDFAQLPTAGMLSAGPWAESRLDAAKKINSVVNALGGKGPFNTTSISSLEELSKDSFRLGAALSSSIGGHEPGFIVQQAVQANPSAANTPQGFSRIVAGLQEAATYEKDRSDFYNDYFAKFGHLNGAEELFSKLNPAQKYAQRAIISTIPQNHVQRLLNSYVADHDNSNNIKEFNKLYGAGSAESILGKSQ